MGYRAVLTRAYAGVRTAERIAEMDRLPVLDAQRRMVEITLDYHAEHPEFVRLVMDENIRRGGQIGAIADAADDNASILSILGALLKRGAKEGALRDGLNVLDLHLAISALAFFPVANRYTILSNFNRDMATPEMRSVHRSTAVELIMRYCRRAQNRSYRARSKGVLRADRLNTYFDFAQDERAAGFAFLKPWDIGTAS